MMMEVLPRRRMESHLPKMMIGAARMRIRIEAVRAVDRVVVRLEIDEDREVVRVVGAREPAVVTIHAVLVVPQPVVEKELSVEKDVIIAG